MSYGLKVRNAAGVVIFDSTSEKVLRFITEQYISGVGFSTMTNSYPVYTGYKIVAMLTSPFQTGDIDGCSVLSCRVSYPSGVPTVSVFVDNTRGDLPIADGYLIIFATGALL